MMVASSLIQVHWRAVRMKVNSCLTIWPSLNGFRVWNHIWSPRLKVLKGFVCFQTKPDLQIMIMNGERQKFPPLEAIICVDSVSPDLVYQRSGRSLDQRPSWEIPHTSGTLQYKKRRCTSGVSPDLVYQARKSADQCTAETVVRNLRRTRPNNKRAIENSAFNFVI